MMGWVLAVVLLLLVLTVGVAALGHFTLVEAASLFAVVSAFGAMLTALQMRLDSIERGRPVVVVDVEITGSQLIHLRLRNIGRGLARRVSFAFDPVPLDYQGRQITTVGIWGKRIPVLKEGMMAEVTFTGSPFDALLIPKDSLVRTSQGVILYLFDPSKDDPQTGSVRQLIVELGISEGNSIQVIDDGIAAGMHVVTEGAERLRPSQNVRIAPEADQRAATKGPPEKPPSP